MQVRSSLLSVRIELARLEAAVNDALTKRPHESGVQVLQVRLQGFHRVRMLQLPFAVKEFGHGVDRNNTVHRRVLNLNRTEHL